MVTPYRLIVNVAIDNQSPNRILSLSGGDFYIILGFVNYFSYIKV